MRAADALDVLGQRQGPVGCMELTVKIMQRVIRGMDENAHGKAGRTGGGTFGSVDISTPRTVF